MVKIRVLLADDHAILRSGLRLLINTQPDMDVVGETGDYEDTLRATRELQPDVLTLDISMPQGDCAQVIETIVREIPATRVLVLTMHDDDAYFRLVMAAGAFGYVVKTAADVELLDAIRAVAQGKVCTHVEPSPAVSSVGPAMKSAQPAESPLETLSNREREVLGLVALGHTNQAVAERLLLSVKTIESYRARLMAKLGLQNRAQLTQFAIEIGLLQSGTPRHNAGDKL
jgi:two-component system response regulator NreC